MEKQFRHAQEVNQRVDVSARGSDNSSIMNLHNHQEQLKEALEYTDEYLARKEMHRKLDDFVEALNQDRKKVKRWVFNTLASFAVNTRRILLVQKFFSSLSTFLRITWADGDSVTNGIGLLDIFEACRDNLTYPLNMSNYRESTQTEFQIPSIKKRSLNDDGSGESDFFMTYEWDYDMDMDAFNDWMVGEHIYDDDASKEDDSLESDYFQSDYVGSPLIRDSESGEIYTSMACDDIMRVQFQHISGVLATAQTTMNALKGILPAYLSKVDEVYSDTTVNPDNVPEHLACTHMLEEITQVCVPLFSSTLVLMEQWTTVDTFDELLNALNGIYMQFLGPDMLRVMPMYAAIESGICYWISNYISDSDARIIERDLDNAVHAMVTAKPWVTYFEGLMSGVEDTLNVSVTQQLQAYDTYLSNGMTKQDLAIMVNGDDFENVMTDLKGSIDALYGTGLKIVDGVTNGRFSSLAAFRKLFELQVSILNVDRIEELYTTQMARHIETDDMDQALEAMEENLGDKYNKVVTILFNEALEPFQKYMKTITDGHSQLRSDVNAYKRTLKTYLSNLEMDQSFFM